MQTTSALYNTILADPNHSFEVKLNIAGVDYGEDVLMAVSIKSKVFENTPIIGGTYASVLTFSMYSDGASIPRMAKVIPYYRAKNEAQTSEWIKKGEFYIDTREVSNNDNGFDVFSAYCYDSMLLANSEYSTSALTWPATDTAVVAEICTQLGLTQDARNAAVMTGGYSIPLPTAYTKRDVLGFIAVMYGANWIMTDEGKLRIVKLTAEGDAVNIGKSLVNLNVGPLQPAYTQVVLTVSTDTAYTSGSTDTEVLDAYCPYATQAVADAVKTALGSWQYQPFDAMGVCTDPALELDDKLTAVDKTGVIFSRDLNFGPSMVMDLSAPYQNDINHEYAFESPTERQYKAEVNGIKSEIRVMEGKIALVVDGDEVNAASIVAAINDSESTVIISADHINLQAYSTTDQMNSAISQSAASITQTVSATYETKTDAVSKLNAAETYADGKAATAESNANGYTDGKLVDYSTTTQMNSAITQSASAITQSVAATYETKAEAAVLNLLPSVYARENVSGITWTNNGVTWTVSPDGSVTVTGTATADSFYYFSGDALSAAVPPVVLDPAKKHRLSGGPSGGSDSTFRYVVRRFDADMQDIGYLYAYSGEVTIPAGCFYACVYAKISSGYAIPTGGLTFRPMLETGETTHGYVSTHIGTGAVARRVASAEAELVVQAGQISSKVSETDYNGNTIASKINQSATTVQISASKIDLQGYVTFTDLSTSGSTEINGANIITETITASKIDLTDLFSQNITATNLNITGGSISISTSSDSTDVIELSYAPTSGAEYAAAFRPGGIYLSKSENGTTQNAIYGPTSAQIHGENQSLYISPARIYVVEKGTFDYYFDLNIGVPGSGFSIPTFSIGDGDSSSIRRVLLNRSSLQFKDSSGNVTFNYPASGLGVAALKNNFSDSVSSGGSKDFDLANGSYLVTVMRNDVNGTSWNGAWLVCVSSNYRNILPVVVGSAPATLSMSGSTLTVTGSYGTQKITITKLD